MNFNRNPGTRYICLLISVKLIRFTEKPKPPIIFLVLLLNHINSFVLRSTRKALHQLNRLTKYYIFSKGTCRRNPKTPYLGTITLYFLLREDILAAFLATVSHGNSDTGAATLLVFRQQRHSAEGFAARCARVLLHVTVRL